MRPRILLVLPQMPQDPASGAARTAQTAVEMAHEAGFEVRALGTTATERGLHAEPLEYLRAAGLSPEVSPAGARGFREFRFEQRGIAYTLLDTGKLPVVGWEKTHGRQFDRLFDAELASFRPDIVLTYGAQEGDRRRHKRARQQGAAIALCIFNQGYLVPEIGTLCDAALTPSEYLAELYRERVGLDSTPLPTPLDFGDVLAPERDPIFVTMVNPSVEKGLFFFVRLAEEVATRLPQVPLLAIESRGTAGMVQQAGLRGGFDLQRHESVMVAPPVPKPRDIFAHTRVLLVPSLFEASGRVVAEALVNGVVPVVSNRGGLEESCNGAGFVLPIPDELTPEVHTPVTAEAVEPWVSLIERLTSDEAFYAAESAKARAAGAIYQRENLAPRYVDFFRRALSSRP